MNIFDPEQPLTLWALLITFVVLASLSLTSYASKGIAIYRRYVSNPHPDGVRLQAEDPYPGQAKDEFKAATILVCWSALYTILMILAWRAGWFPNFYLWPHEHGWGYFAFSIVMLIVLHDAYYYWTHRALHSRLLGRFHATHHRSRVSTPFVMLAFHPVEGLIHYLFFPLILWIMPMSLVALLIGQTLSTAINAYGHLNVEPNRLKRYQWIYPFFAGTPAYHYLHHRHGRGNYTFYFKFWDKVCGTMLPGSDEAIARVQKIWDREDLEASLPYVTSKMDVRSE